MYHHHMKPRRYTDSESSSFAFYLFAGLKIVKTCLTKIPLLGHFPRTFKERSLSLWLLSKISRAWSQFESQPYDVTHLNINTIVYDCIARGLIFKFWIPK